MIVTTHFTFLMNFFSLQVRSLEAVGTLCPGEAGRVQSSIMNTLIEHTSHQDNRVRTAAFNALVSIAFLLGKSFGPAYMGHFSVDAGYHYFVARNGMHVFLWMPTHKPHFSSSHKKLYPPFPCGRSLQSLMNHIDLAAPCTQATCNW